MKKNKTRLFAEIAEEVGRLKTQTISTERRTVLQPLITYIQSKVSVGEEVRLNFICTHNSRRSQLAQVWAQTMAFQFAMERVRCYSGGTESTALFPAAVETLQNSGFEINELSDGQNPVYRISYAENEHPIIGFSKKWDDGFNPKSGFAAIMTCSRADDDCPFIAGAEKRISIPFEDPKKFDNTAQEAEKYRESNLEIATEMLYVFSMI